MMVKTIKITTAEYILLDEFRTKMGYCRDSEVDKGEIMKVAEAACARMRRISTYESEELRRHKKYKTQYEEACRQLRIVKDQLQVEWERDEMPLGWIEGK